MKRTVIAIALALGAGCGAADMQVRPPVGDGAALERDRTATAELAHAEDEAIGWMAAADPRLAARFGAAGSADAAKKIGMKAVLDEDASAVFSGGSLDLFAFRARAFALDEAEKVVARGQSPLPEDGPVGSSIAKPRLERELLMRVLAEERARAEEEGKLGEASGELVRGLVATWTPPAKPQDVQQRDELFARRLNLIRDSLRAGPPRTGPLDLDVALYPLERLLAPTEYPRASAAMAEVRMAIDADMRATPALRDARQVAASVKVHLGVDLDLASLSARLRAVEAGLRERALKAIEATGGGEGARALEGKARGMLLVEGTCASVSDSRVRSMAPPPERAAVCGMLHVLEDDASGAGIIAVHDDLVLALAAILTAPPSRTTLLSHPDDDDVDALRRRARERPVAALAVALAAELLYGNPNPEARLASWRAFGEAPLDVVARALTATP